MVLTAPVPPAAAAVSPLTRLHVPRDRWPWLLGAALAALFVVAVVVAALSPDATNDTPSPGATPSTPRVSASKAAAVRVDPVAYVGKPVAEVKAALGALGLKTRVVTVDNPGGHPKDTVQALRPTGAVAPGTTVTLDVWGAPPAPKGDGHGGDGKPGKGKGKH